MGTEGNRMGGGEQTREVPLSAGVQASQVRGILAERVERNGEPRVQLVSVEQAAKLLACTPAAVRKWLVQRRLPLVKVGRLSRIPAYALAVIAEHGLPEPGTYPRPKSPRGKALDILARQV